MTKFSSSHRPLLFALIGVGILLAFPFQGFSQSVIISEVADPSDEYQARFVELYNPTSSSVDISGWDLRRYANGNTSSCDATIPSSTSIPAGGTYVIARDASVFNNNFSCSPELESGCITGNGDDTYELYDGSSVVDIYGEVGVDGTGEAWEYEDAIAERNSNVCSGNTTWTSSEWTITDPGGTSDATPCSHDADCGCSHSISSISPTEGCPDTGTVTVTINGSGFSGTSDVQFGGVSSSNFSVISDSEIEADVPTDALDGPVKVVNNSCEEPSGTDFDVSCTPCHEVYVNEFSNGHSGSKEYVELIVGNSCGGCQVDLNGWIIDDNNGDFSGGPNTGEGIASGHVRFDPNGDWENIPTGSIILIYNSADENYTIANEPVNDDPYDNNNNDSVYVIPSDHSGLQECTSTPNSSDASYGGCSYSSPASWDPISMANDDDAMQVRKPDASYFHGASYGSDAAFDGGPDNLHVHSSSGTGDCFYFGSPDARDAANWTQGSAESDLSTTDETPGKGNNASNSTEIDNMRTACSTLPIELVRFGGKALEEGNRIRWRTLSEVHHDRYELERSKNGSDFTRIATVEGKGGDGSGGQYVHMDPDPYELSYYRLKSVDMDGSTFHSRIIPVQRRMEGELRLFKKAKGRYSVKIPEASTDGKILIRDAFGRKVMTFRSAGSSIVDFNMRDRAKGAYLLRYTAPDGRTRTRKFVH